MNARTIARLASLFLVGVLPGCDNLFGNRGGPVSQPAPLPASDEGIARACTVSPVDLAASASATATMAVSNEGGWCALRLAEKDGQPFATGLVRVRPDHGRIVIEKSGSFTLVQYFPTPGYTGADTFTAALRSRTPNVADGTVRVMVTVARPS